MSVERTRDDRPGSASYLLGTALLVTGIAANVATALNYLVSMLAR